MPVTSRGAVGDADDRVPDIPARARGVYNRRGDCVESAKVLEERLGESMRLQTIDTRAVRWLVVLAMASAGASSGLVFAGSPTTSEAGVDAAAAERGRVALTLRGFLKPEWAEGAYQNAARFWDQPAPDPENDPRGYAAAFQYRYGLHPAPFANDGLPLGLRRGIGRDGAKTGLQIDCMVCHGGSIGGQSYVGLGNSQLDLKALLFELTMADGRRPPVSTFVLNSSRGTNNAGQIAAVLLSIRNTDLSVRSFPLPLGVNLPEMDTPPWWHIKRKRTMYYDGRTDASSVRSSMQFLLGEKMLDDFKALEPAFRDILAFFKSLEPPKYPFPIDPARAARGTQVFKANCVRCHGTYGPDGRYPNKIIALDVIGTDPARSVGLSDRLVAHFNKTWLGAESPVDTKRVGYQAPPLDGIWATAPYLHNGSVPTLHALLASSTRPARFTRPPSTDFVHYDKAHIGWKFTEVSAEELASTARRSPFQAKFVVDTSRFGMTNGGHTFGDDLSESERLDLIEYLKSL
jgi:Cytochrome c